MMRTAWCLLAALAGGVGWTLAEYLLHRFAGHRRGSRTLFAREHLRHHRELDWFSPAWRKIALAAMIFVVGAPVGWVLLAPSPSSAFWPRTRRTRWATSGCTHTRPGAPGGAGPGATTGSTTPSIPAATTG